MHINVSSVFSQRRAVKDEHKSTLIGKFSVGLLKTDPVSVCEMLLLVGGNFNQWSLSHLQFIKLTNTKEWIKM